MRRTNRAVLIGRRLKQIRTAHGKTQKEIDETLGWKGNKCNKLESGRTGLEPEDATGLAAYYGDVTVEELLADPEPPEREIGLTLEVMRAGLAGAGAPQVLSQGAGRDLSAAEDREISTSIATLVDRFEELTGRVWSELTPSEQDGELYSLFRLFWRRYLDSDAQGRLGGQARSPYEEGQAPA
jgi:transcriptional regulator with XRE-family HTH domain